MSGENHTDCSLPGGVDQDGTFSTFPRSSSIMTQCACSRKWCDNMVLLVPPRCDAIRSFQKSVDIRTIPSERWRLIEFVKV